MRCIILNTLQDRLPGQVFSEPDVMNHSIELETLLAEAGSLPAQRLALFALLNLGLVESLAGGSQERRRRRAPFLSRGELSVRAPASARAACR